MKVKTYRKLAALAAFFCFIVVVYFSAGSFISNKFVSTMKAKGADASVEWVSLSLTGFNLNNVVIKVKNSNTSIKKISSNYVLDNILVQGAIVNGSVEDYMSLRKSGASTGKSSRVLKIHALGANLAFKGRSIVANGITFSSDTGHAKVDILKVGQFVYLEKADFNVHSNSVVIESLRVLSTIEYTDSNIKLKPPNPVELSIPLENKEYSVFIKKINGKVSAKNVRINIKKDKVLSGKVSASDIRYNEQIGAASFSSSFEGWLSSYKASATLTGISVLNKSVQEDAFGIDKIQANWVFSDSIFNGSINFNSISLKAKFSLDGSTPKDFDVLMASTKCSDVVGSIPKSWLNVISSDNYSGSMQFSAKGQSLRDIDLDVLTDCKIQNPSPELNPNRFRKAFTLLVGEDHSQEYSTGPDTPSWVPLYLMNHYIEPVLLVTEDGRFNSHKGFDVSAIETLIQESAKSGTVQRGASTITMQLAKNLWLTRSRSIARKIEELFLAMHLEDSFTKAEILELYLNVIEFGPNTYGIHSGAMYYFGIPPMDLSLKQTLFLGSILPSPNTSYFSEGILNSSQENKLNYTLKVMNTRGSITEEELNDSLLEIVKLK